MTSGSDVTNMVNTLANAHYNVVIAQVLGYMENTIPSHGAHWKSSIIPWSSRVTASFDPLATLCTYAHSKGIEVHAWLGGSGGGPYRVSSTNWPVSSNPTLANHPEWFMVPYTNSEGNAVQQLDGNYNLDMGSSDVQDYIVSIVKELVSNYPIDGINWDDEINNNNQGYGYPAYSQANYSKSGLARYRINNGLSSSFTPLNTDSSWSNYRRRFKSELFARCQAEIENIKTNPRQPVRHTVAPLAYDAYPTSCAYTGLSPYTYFCDWFDQLQNGWVDAAIPQFYRNQSTQATSFKNWIDYSYSCWQYNRQIFAGLGGYLNNMSNSLYQIKYATTGQAGGNGLSGISTYSYAAPTNGTDGVGANWFSYISTNLFTNVVSTPTMTWRSSATATEGIMWGQVKDNTTGLPVDDATVTVTGGSTVKTDGNGYYIATLVSATAAGTVHQLVASKTSMTPATNSTATAVAGDVMRYDLLLNVTTGPSISTQPVSQTVGAGTNVTFSVVSSGPSLSYQWKKNTVNLNNVGNISGATAANLTITSPSTSDAASYTVVVSNSAGSATSSVATLTVVNPPAITGQPQATTATDGQSAQFTVTATGTSLAYQWRLNAAPISGATTSALSLSSLQSTQAGSYSVVITNAAGSVTSGNALLTIVYTLSLSGIGSGGAGVSPSQPTYASNTLVTVTATPSAGKTFLNWAGDATGTSNPLSVTMNANKNIIAVFSDGATDLIVDNPDAAATFTGSWTLSTGTTPFYGTNYSFANTTTGTATSTATYRPTFYAAGRYDVYVWFTSSANRATNAPFTLQHNGTQESFTFDETVNGANVNGSTWTLLASEKQFATGTNDYVYFANNAQASKVVMGDAIKWTYSAVQNAPAITNQPQSLAVNATQSATFNAAASGEALSWTWFKNSSPVSNSGNIVGATTRSLTILSASQSNAGTYTAVASNVLGTATSSTATLTVYDPPAITSQPQSDTSLQGQSVFFVVGATGTAPLNYRWQKNLANLTDGSNISGSSTSALTIRSAGPSDVASYSVIISNITTTTVTSSAATLTIVSNVIPFVSMVSNVDGTVSMAWQADSGTSYTLQYKDNLTDLTWTTLGAYVASSSTLTVTDAPAATVQRFYQLLSAQRVSDPVGFIKLSLLGNSDTFVSLPFARPGATRIIVSSVAGNVVTADGSPNWTANQFVYASGTQSNTYYARFGSGATEGRIYQVTANTANTLTLSLGSDTLSSVAVGDVISIEPYWTLNTVFPNGAGVIASPLAGNRYTELFIPNSDASGINLSASKVYFFNAGIWKQVSDASNNHNDDVLQPNSHFIVRHNVGTNTTAMTLGSVITAKLAITLRAQPTVSQDNYIGLARPVAASLNDSGLVTSGAFSASPLPGSRTDELLIFNNAAIGHNKSASADYYYWNNAWRQVGAGSTDVGANLIFQPGNAVIIRKYTNSISPVWTNSPNW
ncbi:MAG: TIGR02597 family protein [Limisphaerales bacterium]